MAQIAPQVLNAATLASALDHELAAPTFRDYCPNGLQVESSREIKRLVTGVTASQSFIEQAIAAGADALLVHHGLMWKGDDGRLTGFRYQRVKALIANDIALLAYHLPLDAHATLGNNAQLAKLLGIAVTGTSPDEPLVLLGQIPAAQKLAFFGNIVQKKLSRAPQLIGDLDKSIQKIALCTGGGQSFFETAIAHDVDAYITGEISEQHVHIARETGVAFIAAGHHATERYGVQALGAWVAERFSLEHRFIDVDSPV
jgi:dinuclear metal center YbgI/SA1388 family protein